MKKIHIQYTLVLRFCRVTSLTSPLPVPMDVHKLTAQVSCGEVPRDLHVDTHCYRYIDVSGDVPTLGNFFCSRSYRFVFGMLSTVHLSYLSLHPMVIKRQRTVDHGVQNHSPETGENKDMIQ